MSASYEPERTPPDRPPPLPAPPARAPAPWQVPGAWPQPQPQPQAPAPAPTAPAGGYPTAAPAHPPAYPTLITQAAGTGTGGRSRALVPLAAVTVLALLFAAGSALWWSGERSARAQEITTLEADHAAHRRAMDQRQAALDASYRAVALDTRWTRLDSANVKQSAVSDALNKKYPTTTYVLTADAFALVAARRACFVALIEYNQGAAQFSDRRRGTLPGQVDMTDPKANCSALEWHD